MSFPKTLQLAIVEIKRLVAELDEKNKRLEDHRGRLSNSQAAETNARAAEKVAQDQFADLKKRLFDSEMERQRLVGYTQRVQEDDVVREDLVTVGEPGGEQRMVPKRKSAAPFSTMDYREVNQMTPTYDQYGRERVKPKHWIEY